MITSNIFQSNCTRVVDAQFFSLKLCSHPQLLYHLTSRDEITNQPCEVPYTPHVNIFAPYHFLYVPLRNFYIAKIAEIKEKDGCPVKFSVNDVTRIPLHFTLRVNQDFTSLQLVKLIRSCFSSPRQFLYVL